MARRKKTIGNKGIAIIAAAIAVPVAVLGAMSVASEPAPLAYALPTLGDEDAPITIEEWGDYQCTFCYRFHDTKLDVIKEEYIETGRAKLVFMDFTLNGPDSVLAAEASHCAGDQGMFWEYHDALYENWGGERTGWITTESLAGFAGGVGLDTEEFGECLESRKYTERVEQTREHGVSKGINSTPSFLISNGEKTVKISGNQPLSVFTRTLDDL